MGTSTMAMAIMPLISPSPSTAAMVSANTSAGRAMTLSSRRISVSSTLPPR